MPWYKNPGAEARHPQVVLFHGLKPVAFSVVLLRRTAARSGDDDLTTRTVDDAVNDANGGHFPNPAADPGPER
jgi:hypothetical protein